MHFTGLKSMWYFFEIWQIKGRGIYTVFSQLELRTQIIVWAPYGDFDFSNFASISASQWIFLARNIVKI